MNKWIETKDNLPEISTGISENGYLVGVYIGGKFRIAVAPYRNGKFRAGDHNTTMDGTVHPIMFWMDLPGPPE